MREILLDTETTGLDPRSGHRIVEVACVELVNRKLTGTHFHRYINPERDVPADAARIHGLTTSFLRSHPVFSTFAQEMLDFIGDSPLVIHNAPFDMKFIRAEYQRLAIEAFQEHTIIDTLDMARKAYPRQGNSLDALCKRFNISLETRDKHGALIDCELLARVYYELTGGSQKTFTFNKAETNMAMGQREEIVKELKPARPFLLSDEDRAHHQQMVVQLKNPLWDQYKDKVSA